MLSVSTISRSLLKVLGKAMAPQSSTLAWKIPWMEEPGRLRSMGWLRQKLHFHFSLSCIGEGNGNPLQCSCLENLRGRGVWRADVYGVQQSKTQLKWLSSSSIESLLLWAVNDARILGLQRRGIWFRASDEGWQLRAFCVLKLLKHKRDIESFWCRHQKGQKECPLASF